MHLGSDVHSSPSMPFDDAPRAMPAAPKDLHTIRSKFQQIYASGNNGAELYGSLLELSRAGIDENSLETASAALGKLLAAGGPGMNLARLCLLRAEICLARGDLDTAQASLRDVTSNGFQLVDRLWAANWETLIAYLNGNYQLALIDAQAMQSRFGRASPAHVGYFQLMEALVYMAKAKKLLAGKALEKAAASGTLWSIAARHYLTSADAPSFENAVAAHCPSQAAEACFLAAELFYHAGARELALTYFNLCLNLPAQRAMISRLAKSRLVDFSAKRELKERGV
jgi:hypothetical protein